MFFMINNAIILCDKYITYKIWSTDAQLIIYLWSSEKLVEILSICIQYRDLTRSKIPQETVKYN
jgi:hypothetical protein